MSVIHGFELIREKEIQELKTKALLYCHKKTGAELLSLINDDENKVFGISFRTPPSDSTGLPHILEHSVLCGSRKYPVKEPFVELLKGSLQTFLNAMTYPDKTCYPLASQNLQDFYNLIDVYLDAVFYPRLTPFILQQEGWHYELDKIKEPLIYKGVVFNEMKGSYSSPESLLSEYSFQSLFPDTAYGFDSGGDPKKIPDLIFEQFKAFHGKYYHPTNSRIYFYGDDDPEKRLEIANEYLKDFDRIEVKSTVALQPHFDKPQRLIRSFAAGGEENGPKGMFTLNWLLPETLDRELILSLSILEYILLGMPGSPLRKALIDSGLGEDLAGVGLGTEVRQMYFSAGLKGVEPDNADKVQELVLNTLSRLVNNGIDSKTIEAALNMTEFALRENNSGSYPRGLLLMLGSLTTWLYDGDPFALLAWEEPLQAVKLHIASENGFFETLIDKWLIKNRHRTAVVLRPDPGLGEEETAAEEAKLKRVKDRMTEDELENIISNTKELRLLQEAPDPPSALEAIPMLGISDLDTKNKTIPIEKLKMGETEILYHDLFTNGIAYLDIGFDLHSLPQKYLPYTRIFGRALLEMGTEKEDYVTVTQRISRKTGGIGSGFFTSGITDSKHSATMLLLQAKAMMPQTQDMLDIIQDVLLNVRLDNQARFKQMLLETKARVEQNLVPSGHRIVNKRLRSHFTETDWAAEEMSGLNYLFFLRKLVEDVDNRWESVLNDLRQMHRILINRNAVFINATLDQEGWAQLMPQIRGFLDVMPVQKSGIQEWEPGHIQEFEGLTIPSRVNYVGKGSNIYSLGYNYHGSIHVICRYLGNSLLWDRVRVQGGAYGGFCMFERLTGTLTFVSYRDPNLLKTLDVFDQAAGFLRHIELSDEELLKGIIGSIGNMDEYMLPDAKGYASMVRYFSGVTDDDRQKVRDEILGTTIEDFRAFAEVLEEVKVKGMVKVLGSQEAIKKSMETHKEWLNVINVI
jgi:Zn-dependent M16 (insulinase) family peptidase